MKTYEFLQVAVVAFKRGHLKVLSLAWDRDLGGRDFDEALFNHFVDEFNKRFSIDIRSNKRASFRLRQSIEKASLPHACQCAADRSDHESGNPSKMQASARQSVYS